MLLPAYASIERAALDRGFDPDNPPNLSKLRKRCDSRGYRSQVGQGNEARSMNATPSLRTRGFRQEQSKLMNAMKKHICQRQSHDVAESELP